MGSKKNRPLRVIERTQLKEVSVTPTGVGLGATDVKSTPADKPVGEHKTCNCCGVIRPIAQYHVKKGKAVATCKHCIAAQALIRNAQRHNVAKRLSKNVADVKKEDLDRFGYLTVTQESVRHFLSLSKIKQDEYIRQVKWVGASPDKAKTFACPVEIKSNAVWDDTEKFAGPGGIVTENNWVDKGLKESAKTFERLLAGPSEAEYQREYMNEPTVDKGRPLRERTNAFLVVDDLIRPEDGKVMYSEGDNIIITPLSELPLEKIIDELRRRRYVGEVTIKL